MYFIFCTAECIIILHANPAHNLTRCSPKQNVSLLAIKAVGLAAGNLSAMERLAQSATPKRSTGGRQSAWAGAVTIGAGHSDAEAVPIASAAEALLKGFGASAPLPNVRRSPRARQLQ